jgi:curli biogenesis system outer membrane secretion channel CsgG
MLLAASVTVSMPAAAYPSYHLQGSDLIATNVTSVQPIPIAVLDFHAVGGPEQQIAEAVAENLRNALVQHRQFTVIERTQIQQVLKEQVFAQSGLGDNKEAVVLGKLLGAHVIVVGSVTKLGDIYTVNESGRKRRNAVERSSRLVGGVIQWRQTPAE